MIQVGDFIMVLTHFITSPNHPQCSVVVGENVNATSVHYLLSFLPDKRTHVPNKGVCFIAHPQSPLEMPELCGEWLNLYGLSAPP